MPNWKKIIVSGSDAVLKTVAATSLTGSLSGTASFATQAQTASLSLTATTASYILNAVSASFAVSSSRAISSSFAASATFATNTTNATTASSVNTLNQNVLITGSLTVGSSSLGASENTLTLGARDTSNEGGQIGFNAPGGTYTSASFIDNWQNKARILKGNNTTSTGLIAQWDIHTTQMQLAGYTAASSFPGTATANLAVDSGGNVITVSTTGGSVFPYTGNAVITGSLTATTGFIAPNTNGAMYLRGGDDVELWDINISNHLGVYGQQDATIASIKLGSGGGIISGRNNNIGIGTITPNARLDVSGSAIISGSLIVTNGITGSLLGTASYATNADTLDGLDSANFVQTNGAQTITGNKSFRDTTFFGTDSSDGKITFVEQTAGLSASISIDSEANLIIQNAEDTTFVTIYQNGDGIELASGTFTGNLTGNADTATTASFASTASFVTSLNQNVTVTGSFTVITGSNVELQVLNTGVRLGNIITDAHTVTGSLGVSGSSNFRGNILITGSANNSLNVRGSGATSATSAILTQNSSGTTTFTVRDDGKVVVGSNSATAAQGKLTIFQGTTSAADGLNFQLASNDANQLYVGATSTSNIQIGFNGAGWNFSGTSLRNTLASNNSYGTFTMAPNAGNAAGGINVQGSFTDLGLTGGFGVLALAGGNSYNDSLSMTLTTAGNGNAPGQSATLYAGRTYTISGSQNNIASIVLNSTFNQTQTLSSGSITGISHIPVITSAYNYRAFDFSNTTAYTPNAAMTNYVWSRISANISASVNSQQIAGLDIILSGSNSAFTGVRRSALRLSTQNITDSALTAIGGVIVTGSLNVAGTTRLSGSFNTAASGSVLTIIGSGSAQPIFTVQGSQGELFSITDSLSGSLFSVNDISGLPIMEVFSDNTILMGDYQDPMMLTTKKIAQTNSGSFVVYSIPTSSYDGAFIDYTIKSGSNARAGTIMSTWAGSSIEFTEVDTMDIGSTTAVGLTMILSGSNAVMTGSSSTGAWTIRTIIRTI